MEVLSSLCYCRGKNGTFKYCIRDRFKLFKSRSGWWHFCKFPLGIIIRHDAGNALKIIENSVEPLVVKDAVATITELSSGKWFDRCAWDDFYPGLYEKKKGKSEELQVSRRGLGIFERFTDFYSRYDRDLVVTTFHTSENNLICHFRRETSGVRMVSFRLVDRKDPAIWIIYWSLVASR